MVLVSGVQQSDSVILFQTLFPFRLLQYTECSSLCYTVGLCWLSIPYQIKMTVFLLSCNSFLSVTPVLTCHCKKFETKMSSNLDFAGRIRLSLYQHVGYCVCVCVCVCACARACILVCTLTGHKLWTIIPQLQLSFMTFLLVGIFHS